MNALLGNGPAADWRPDRASTKLEGRCAAHRDTPSSLAAGTRSCSSSSKLRKSMKLLREDAAEGDDTAAALVEAVESEEGAAARCVTEMVQAGGSAQDGGASVLWPRKPFAMPVGHDRFMPRQLWPKPFVHYFFMSGVRLRCEEPISRLDLGCHHILDPAKQLFSVMALDRLPRVAPTATWSLARQRPAGQDVVVDAPHRRNGYGRCE